MTTIVTMMTRERGFKQLRILNGLSNDMQRHIYVIYHVYIYVIYIYITSVPTFFTPKCNWVCSAVFHSVCYAALQAQGSTSFLIRLPIEHYITFYILNVIHLYWWLCAHFQMTMVFKIFCWIKKLEHVPVYTQLWLNLCAIFLATRGISASKFGHYWHLNAHVTLGD